MGPLLGVLSLGLAEVKSVDTLMILWFGSWDPFKQVQAQGIVSRALIAKQKIKIWMMFRLQCAPGDLFLPYEHKIYPGNMITMHKGGIKYFGMNSSQIVVLDK